MNNEEMLEKVRLDRPNQVIHEVLSFELNKYNLYDVNVVMETNFFEIKITENNLIIPYPLSEYEKLKTSEQVIWFYDTFEQSIKSNKKNESNEL